MADVKTTETQDTTEETKVEITETTTSDKSETTQDTGDQSTKFDALLKTVNNIAAKVRKGEVDPETLQNFNASVDKLADLKKPVEPDNDLIAEVAALKKQVNDGEFNKRVLEIKTANGLSDSDLDLISDPDLDKFEKRAIEMGNRNKLSNHREAKKVIPDDLKDNEFARRFL